MVNITTYYYYSEPHPDFHAAVTSARHFVWRQYGFWGNAVTKSNQPSVGPVKIT
ncbi:hypothetical protein Hanom_Chr04g00350961 [Helianthus anomalus]